MLPLLASERVLGVGRGVGRFFGRLGLRFHTEIEEMARGHASTGRTARRARLRPHAADDRRPMGQRVSANDRLYLAEEVPFLIIWGKRDRIIPVAHAQRSHERVPASRLEIFERAGHFPQVDEPQRFIEVLEEFIDSTEPAEVAPERWRVLLRQRGGAALRLVRG